MTFTSRVTREIHLDARETALLVFASILDDFVYGWTIFSEYHSRSKFEFDT